MKGTNLLSIICALLIGGLLIVAQPPRTFFAIYYCLTLWAVVIADSCLTRKQIGTASRWSFEDRCLGYLFVAPLTWPVKLYALAKAR